MAVRIKWFVPSDGEQSFKPFGIECEGFATPYAHGGGPAPTGKSGDYTASPTDLAKNKHTYRARLDRPLPRIGLRPRSEQRRTQP
ncbi:hypothetical protein ACQPYA_00195 [Micromonospora sp. CA-263727]|uniref:hypothetical protein n=1 Tax=Micromonospora sp. CA-263727 TaxID=3239967 RepID=UPI003D92130E